VPGRGEGIADTLYNSFVMLSAPRFGSPGHIRAADRVTGRCLNSTPRGSIQKFAPARLLGKIILDGRYTGLYKLRSYKFTCKMLMLP
jgi:hypothetical protein